MITGGDGVHTELTGVRKEVTQSRGTIQHGVFGVHMQVCEAFFRHGLSVRSLSSTSLVVRAVQRLFHTRRLILAEYSPHGALLTRRSNHAGRGSQSSFSHRWRGA